MTETELDEILTLQLAFAWAGESAPDADERRLGWWRTDLIAEFGGLALLERLTPRTFKWAVYEAAREAARLVDTRTREVDAGADGLISLFHLGHPADEELDDRLRSLKASGVPPVKALPRLGELVVHSWDSDRFVAWLEAGEPPNHDREPAGLRIKGARPASAAECARTLAALLSTLPDQYPGAYYRDDASR